MEVLTRRKKNNPVLIGEPGVGQDGHSSRARATDRNGEWTRSRLRA